MIHSVGTLDHPRERPAREYLTEGMPNPPNVQAFGSQPRLPRVGFHRIRRGALRDSGKHLRQVRFTQTGMCPLRQQLLNPLNTLNQVLVTERVRQPQVPIRSERLARHHCHLNLVENDFGELG